MTSSLKTLREAVDRGRTPGGRLRASARSDVAGLIEEARAAGSSYGAIASSLEVSAQTLRRWRGNDGSAALAVVRVVDDRRPTDMLVVHGPRGLRIEGLSLDELAALLGKLSS
jgi:hypothetical protein